MLVTRFELHVSFDAGGDLTALVAKETSQEIL